MSIAELRRDYTLRGLSENEVASEPFTQFQTWFDQALAAQVPEPNAMTVATATPDGSPSARIVLLKGFDERGFVFYTNYTSRKGQELAFNPRAALIFYWPDLERQIRIEGVVELASVEESDSYFASRPIGSRLGAWASPQSQIIADRSVVDDRMQQLLRDEPQGAVKRPPHWGGYRVIPHLVEFWQGRPSRLHDRLRYRKHEQSWILERLAP